MPLVPMSQLLADAKRGGYAVCYCESWNLESFQAVMEAAEELKSPIIAGFNGGFLMHKSRSKPETLAFYAGMGLAIGESKVPVSFLLNESDDLKKAVESLNALALTIEQLKDERLWGLISIPLLRQTITDSVDAAGDSFTASHLLLAEGLGLGHAAVAAAEEVVYGNCCYKLKIWSARPRLKNTRTKPGKRRFSQTVRMWTRTGI